MILLIKRLPWLTILSSVHSKSYKSGKKTTQEKHPTAYELLCTRGSLVHRHLQQQSCCTSMNVLHQDRPREVDEAPGLIRNQLQWGWWYSNDYARRKQGAADQAQLKLAQMMQVSGGVYTKVARAVKLLDSLSKNLGHKCCRLLLEFALGELLVKLGPCGILFGCSVSETQS